MSLRPAFSFLIDLSGRVLRSAWNDLYFNDHTWSVEKAHRAALLALRAAAWRAGVESMADSLSHLAHLLSPACPRLSEISGSIVFLDALRELVSSIELRLVVEPGKLELRKQDSLNSIEYAIKVRNSAIACSQSTGKPPDYVETLKSYAEKANATIILAPNHRALIVSEAHERLDPLDRIYREAEKIPLGATPILLTPEEAYSLLSLPGIHERASNWTIIEDRLSIGEAIPAKRK